MRKYLILIGLFFCVIINAQNPLFIPPSLTGTTFNLNIQNGVTQFYPSINTPTYGINGPLLGPTLIVNKGDIVTMNVTNSLTGNGNATTMHWHGMHVPAMDDGGPHQLILQNTTWSPSFEIKNDAATFWYHPHGAGKTDLHVSKGLAGMIIVKDAAEAALTLPRTYGIDDFPIIVQTKSFDVLNQIAISTQYDTVVMVNGTIAPFLNAPAQVVRLRLLNGSSGRTFMFGFSNNMNFQLIANDGGLLDTALTLNRILLSNGERAEILVDLSALLNSSVLLMNYGTEIPLGIMGADSVGNATYQILDYYNNPLNGSDYKVMNIVVGAQTSNPVTTIPTSLVPFTPWSLASATINRNFVLDTLTEGFTMPQPAEGPFGINRKFFAMDSINEVVYLNDIETWTIINSTLVAHPFHVHDVQFYLVDINGAPVPNYEHGKKDVVLVMPGDTVRFITKFEDFADDSVPYMYHCHILHHEDDGMMGSFLVLDTNGTSVREYISNALVSVYPNPSDDIWNVNGKSDTKIVNAVLYNAFGEVVVELPIEQHLNSFSIKINNQNLSKGFYILKIDGTENIVTVKLIKN